MAEFRAFWLPQHGNSPEEYQDAFAGDAAAGRFAVADGATESGFAGPWARLLVEGFVADTGGPDAFAARLPELQSRWRAELPAGPLPWYAEVKAERGAFATFLGLALGDSADEPGREWQAAAVGDACLFHTRGDRLLAAFPLDRADQFTNSPHLLGSRVPAAAYWEKHAVRCSGRALPGDRLWLATDAFAQWCLGECEAGRGPWGELQELCTVEQGDACFAEWTAGLRNRPLRRLRNDDVTLLAIPVVNHHRRLC